MCRQKKVRCDVVLGGCAQCIKYKTPCHFTPISMTRAPRRSGRSVRRQAQKTATKLKRLNVSLLTSLRDKRVEELEKRLKAMEDLVKHPLSNQQPGLNGAEFGNDSGKPEAPPLSDPLGAGTSDSSSDLNLAATKPSEDCQTLDLDLPSPESKCEPVKNLSDLTVLAFFARYSP